MVPLAPPATRYRKSTEGLIFRILYLLYLGVDPGSLCWGCQIKLGKLLKMKVAPMFYYELTGPNVLFFICQRNLTEAFIASYKFHVLNKDSVIKM